MRSSSLSQHLLLQSRAAAQFLLPYSAEVENPTTAGQADRVIRSPLHGSGENIPAPPEVGAQKTNVSKRKNGKRKPPAEATVPPHLKLLVSREEAAEMLSISIRGVDYLIATKRLSTRRIGTRVLIPIEDARRFARSDHPERMAG